MRSAQRRSVSACCRGPEGRVVVVVVAGGGHGGRMTSFLQYHPPHHHLLPHHEQQSATMQPRLELTPPEKRGSDKSRPVHEARRPQLRDLLWSNRDKVTRHYRDSQGGREGGRAKGGRMGRGGDCSGEVTL